MKYRVELRGEHGERIIVGTARNAESIQEVIARANRMNAMICNVRQVLTDISCLLFDSFIPLLH